MEELITFVLRCDVDVQKLRVEKREDLFLIVILDRFKIALIAVLRLIMSHFV